ncbi:DUF2271 domain-containing protein [Pedobacter nanyangensis]|uniref:DUF2271 domain-containing protein n=1 Tax=Pedobacter nanyangensis TaxID=1562389 RepID=UPI000DE45271|nr:DUF2271 domain-containing protein [Pedobacter nanyangensis]
MKILATIFTSLTLISLQPNVEEKPLKSQLYVLNHEQVLGTSLELKIISTSETEVYKAEQAAIEEINRLSNILSAYHGHSEFSRWMKSSLNVPVKVSKELFEVLSLFEQWKRQTNGALDPSVAVASKLWREAALNQNLPTKSAVQKAIFQMQAKHYQLDLTNLTATRLDLVPLVMNSFAKSYIINKACDAALAAGKIENIVVNIGGDLVTKGGERDLVYVTNPLKNAENDAPLAKLTVMNKAVATSGNYRRGQQIGKNWYSHIIDPRTAKPVGQIISATVIAENAIDAGALATAFNILSLQESKLLAEKSGAAYLIVTREGKIVESANWDAYVLAAEVEETPVVARSTYAENQKMWDPKFELTINFRLNAIEDNSHRPYAAIWVENEKRESVRNLALWYRKTNWIPDLRNWYRIHGERFKADKDNYASVTGATRNPGSYTLKWDGKDDKGNYVPQGRYTVIIETAKEHGTNEIIRQALELKKTPIKAVSAGNVEVAAVNFEFGKRK